MLRAGVQEYFLHALSQPRPHASLDLTQDPCRDVADNGMRRSHSYHGLDPLGIPSAVYGAMHNIHASFIQAAHARQAHSHSLPCLMSEWFMIMMVICSDCSCQENA